MQQRFNDQMEALGAREKRILLAISGGIDSVVLLDLLIKAGVRPALAHANFQLRGDASDKDEAFVRDLSERHGLPVFVRRFDTKNYAEEHRVSIQMAARDLRYRWFDALLEEHSFDHIATAHHLNDSVETVLNNLVRGTGVAGLTGIAGVNGKILRPLLPFLKTDIASHASGNQLVWREDASNDTIDYQRNFIRHEVVPKLKTLNPSLEETFARTMKRVAGTEELAALAMKMLRARHFSSDGERISISKALLEGITNRSGILFELIREYGFNLSQCNSIVEAMDGQPGKSFDGPGFTLVTDRTTFVISPVREKLAPVQIVASDTEGHLASLRLTIETTTRGSISSDRNTATLDRDAVSFPLVWRPWKEGDEFHPLGMQGRKKVSDFLIDSKVSMSDKRQVTVIESAGKIVWIVGYRIDDRFKVRAESNSILQLTVTQNG